MDGLVPQLVGLERTRRRLVPFKDRDSGPIVQVVGGRGSGKSAMLDALYEGYHNRLPLARADLAAAGFGQRELADLAEDDTPNSSPITSLLYLLSDQLGLKADRFNRGLKFRRLSVGLLVVSAWQPGGATAEEGPAPVRPANLRDAERRLFEILRADDGDQKRRKEVLEQWLDALLPAVSGAVGVPAGLDPMFRAVVKTARELLLAPRPDRGALHWWREQLSMATGDSLQRLYSFVLDFRNGPGDRRRKAETLLIAALLADIDENYGRLRNLNDTPHPLILLDNLHGPLGARFLDLLLLAYQKLPRAAGRVTRPVIVAGLLGDPKAVTALADVESSAWPGRPVSGDAGGPRVLWLGLPPVQRDDIMAMLSPLDYPPHLPLLIERLSGGRPSSARMLADAAKRLPATGDSLRMEEFHALFGPTSSGVLTGRLLEQLLPAPHLQGRLPLLSAALDDAAARRLWGSFHAEENAFARVREVREHLDETRWNLRAWPGTGGTAPFVADRALRTLLLRQLRADLSDERWDQAQRRLRSGYDPVHSESRSDGREARYLHHSLALGESDLVVRFLHQGFGRDGLRDWLTMVNIVCAAPLAAADLPQHALDTLAQPLDLARCTACADPVGVPVHKAIKRLVLALWRQSDPLAVPRDDYIERVESALHTLYEHVEENDTLQRAHRDWPKRLREGVQAPELPVAGGFGA
ncbi:hypothetical protein [Kitasatospora sp. MAP5-34]|uniref:hypothetical protein n=1 Tax=Kitasatospora sp. MAP5-34 TaxID=3035102 RepID=UPI00247615FC|nr:hypothetical protein [Kitasatospora sp. MAP5-34]